MDNTRLDAVAMAGRCGLFAGIGRGVLELLFSCLGARVVKIEKGRTFIRAKLENLQGALSDE